MYRPHQASLPVSLSLPLSLKQSYCIAQAELNLQQSSCLSFSSAEINRHVPPQPTNEIVRMRYITFFLK